MKVVIHLAEFSNNGLDNLVVIAAQIIVEYFENLMSRAAGSGRYLNLPWCMAPPYHQLVILTKELIDMQCSKCLHCYNATSIPVISVKIALAALTILP